MNWSQLDLNLLRVLDALLSEPNTTRVADRIGMSQPAVSKSLGRLRYLLGDPLFVRQGSGLAPTPYALSLAEELRGGLATLRHALDRSTFEPSCSSRTFRILGDDFLLEMLTPMVAALADAAPLVRLRLLPIVPDPVARRLAEERIDFVFARLDDPPPGWVDFTLALHAAPVVVASRGNAGLAAAGVRDRGPIPLDLYCGLPQVAFAPDDAPLGREDAALKALGRRRDVKLSVPDFFGLAHVVARTQLIGSLPGPFALSIAGAFDLTVHPLPFRVPPVPLGLFWHRRNAADPEHAWMRARILDHLEPFDAKRHPTALSA